MNLISCKNKFEHINLKLSDYNDSHLINGIYPCFFCNSFIKPIENKLLFEIYYLQLDNIKNILNNMTEEQILNYKKYLYNPNITTNENILDFILFELIGSSGGISFPVCLKYISYMNITNYNKQNANFKIFIDKLIEIINFICNKCPKLITKKMIEHLTYRRCTKLVKILSNYYINDKFNKNTCYICMADHDVNLIKMPCTCNMYIHLECLVELVNNNGKKCMTCRNSLGVVIDKKKRIHFPKLNIYKAPLVNQYLIIDKDNIIESLRYAIIYLQIDKVKEILNNMTSEQFQFYKKNVRFGGLHKLDKNNNKLKLADSLFSNFNRRSFPGLFNLIENELSKKDI
jgi:hypothetical protein